MADERYQKLLGIEPADEVPTYYELLVLERNETDEEVLEKAYKTQMRKLQAIRTSKDKGFMEFLKEELRKARRTLTNKEKRKAYDESLLEDSIESFQDFVQPLMALGQISKSVFDTMVAKGVSDGLTEAKAREVIEALAKEHNATIESDEGKVEDPSFTDQAPDSRSGGEVVLKAPTGALKPSGGMGDGYYNKSMGGGYGTTEEAAPESAPAKGPWGRKPRAPQESGGGSSPWGRRGSRGEGSAWGRGKSRGAARAGGANNRRAAPADSTQGQRNRWMDQQTQRQYDAAVRIFNLGAKLAKIANDVHQKLRMYFPPANGKSSRTYQINGVSYEKVFDTEQKTYRDTLKKFESAAQRLNGLDSPVAVEVLQRTAQNIALVKSYLDEIRQHKLRQLAGLSKSAELRAWQEFVNSRRSSRLCQMIQES